MMVMAIVKVTMIIEVVLLLMMVVNYDDGS